MKALLIPVEGEPQTIEVCGLKDLQKAVGGRIEPMSWLFDDAPAIWVNEEGKFTCEPNRALFATAKEDGASFGGEIVKEGDIVDIIYGNIVAIGFDPETGEDRDITDEEIERVLARLGKKNIVASGGVVLAVIGEAEV